MGVTAPAVNKWEKGISYPDILLLSPLARLLDIDPNTLLCFESNLSEQEIGLFLNTLTEQAEQYGFESAYCTAMKKIKEYPTCYSLILNTALWIDGAAMLAHNTEKRNITQSLYLRVAECSDTALQYRAKSVLIQRYLSEKDYAKAEELLNTLPDEITVNKKQLQANLLTARHQYDQAAKLLEEKLLSSVNENQTTLLSLMELAYKQHRTEDAASIAETCKQQAKLFDLWEYNSYIAHFQLYTLCKKPLKCLEILLPMLKSLSKVWNPNQSPLYRHIKAQKTEKGFSQKLQSSIVQSVCQEKEFEFLSQNTEFQESIKEFSGALPQSPQAF